MKPTLGLKFKHRRVLDPTRIPDKVPQVYQVTRIAGGMVYYRAIADYGTRTELVGGREYVAVTKWHTVCLEVV